MCPLVGNLSSMSLSPGYCTQRDGDTTVTDKFINKKQNEAQENLYSAKKEHAEARKELRDAEVKLHGAEEKLRGAEEKLRTANMSKQDVVDRVLLYEEKLEKAEASGVKTGLKTLKYLYREAKHDLTLAKKVQAAAQAGVGTAQAGVDTVQSDIRSLQLLINEYRLSISKSIFNNGSSLNLKNMPWWKSSGIDGKKSVVDEHMWEHCEEASEYLHQLEIAEPIIVPVEADTSSEQMNLEENEELSLHVFDMQMSLQKDESSTNNNLVLPKSTRDFWETVHQVGVHDDRINRLLVVGTPGLGKSRSINYFFRVVLQKHRKLPADVDRSLPVIVFEHRKDETVWLFAPKDPRDRQSKYSAFVLSLMDFKSRKCPALQIRGNYYIVDTASAENARMPVLCDANTIYVCSPDPRHYSEYQKHCNGTFYFPSWREEYIPAATPYMIPTYSALCPEEAVERAQVVGAIPRRVYGSQDTYEDFKEKVDTFVANRQEDVYAVIQTGAFAIDSGSNDQKHPRSTIFLYETSIASYFKRAGVNIVSYYARLRLRMNCLRLVMSAIRGNVSKARQIEFGRLFEVAVTNLIWRVGLETDLMSFHQVSAETTGKLERHPAKRKMNIAKSSFTDKSYYMMDTHKQMYARMKELGMVNAATSESRHSLSFIGGNFPLLDAADARNRGFNYTLQNSPRKINLNTVAKLRTSLGLDLSEMFHLIYIVDEGKADTFQVSFKNVTEENMKALDQISVHVMALPDGFVQNNAGKFMDETQKVDEDER